MLLELAVGRTYWCSVHRTRQLPLSYHDLRYTLFRWQRLLERLRQIGIACSDRCSATDGLQEDIFCRPAAKIWHHYPYINGCGTTTRGSPTSNGISWDMIVACLAVPAFWREDHWIRSLTAGLPADWFLLFLFLLQRESSHGREIFSSVAVFIVLSNSPCVTAQIGQERWGRQWRSWYRSRTKIVLRGTSVSVKTFCLLESIL